MQYQKRYTQPQTTTNPLLANQWPVVRAIHTYIYIHTYIAKSMHISKRLPTYV